MNMRADKMENNTSEILRVSHLKKYFPVPAGMLHAVDDISFAIDNGKTLGVVGESGCGKSTMGRAILRLHEPTSGEVYFQGKDVLSLDKKGMKELRRDMQIVFQDPYASLNPRMTVSEAIAAPLLVQKIYNRKNKADIEKRVKEIMNMVGLANRLINTYPHELDGGRRQRIGIARALALNPKFIVCDEPVSALDVSIQAQILNLMADLQEDLGLTYLFITHDLSVVKYVSDDILVMYLGQMVEKAPSDKLFKKPMHPYTQALLSAIPIPDPDLPMNRITMKGELSSPINPGIGCRFAKRCPYAADSCSQQEMVLTEEEPGHFVTCQRVQRGEI